MKRYVLDIGLSQDWLALQIAMSPCLVGYGVIAKQLHADSRSKREDNLYWAWIQNYVSDDYLEALKVGSGECIDRNQRNERMADRNKELLERHAVLQSPARIEELAKIFIHATKVSQTTCCFA
jgi:thiaminase